MEWDKREENREFHKKLITLVLPIAFQQFMLSVVSASDALMLGSVGQDALSAVSLATQIQFVFNLFLAAITIGTSIFAAQYWGKGDKDTVEKLLSFSLKLSVGVSFVFFLAVMLFATEIMQIFTSDPALIINGCEYLQTVGVSYVFCGVSQIYLCIMKNSGQAGKCTLISAVAVILNILLNALLIFGLCGLPRMEIRGAALATVIARTIEMLWTVSNSLGKNRIRVRLSYLRHTDRQLSNDFWKYTLPVMGNELVWGCGFTMYSVIMGHLGSDAVAANSIANIVKNLISCFCMGLGGGSGIIVGNELGAGKPERAKEYGGKLCRLSIVSGAVSGLILVALSPIILKYTDLTPQASSYLKGMLWMCSYYLIGKAVNGTVISGIFCAGGDSRFGFVCDTITMWIVTVPLGMLAAFVWKLPIPVVYFIINLDEIVKLPAVYKHYKKYMWIKDLTRKQEIGGKKDE